MFRPLMAALLSRNGQSHYKQADETRWLVFVEQQGKWALVGGCGL